MHRKRGEMHGTWETAQSGFCQLHPRRKEGQCHLFVICGEAGEIFQGFFYGIKKQLREGEIQKKASNKKKRKEQASSKKKALQ